MAFRMQAPGYVVEQLIDGSMTWKFGPCKKCRLSIADGDKLCVVMEPNGLLRLDVDRTPNQIHSILRREAKALCRKIQKRQGRKP